MAVGLFPEILQLDLGSSKGPSASPHTVPTGSLQTVSDKMEKANKCKAVNLFKTRHVH